MKMLMITIAVILGTIILAGVGFYVYKNISDKPVATIEQSSDIDAEQILTESGSSSKSTKSEKSAASLSGVFQKVDSVHKGSGTATITESSGKPVIVFSKDFKVTTGPDLLVYLSPNEAASPLGEFVSLGKLKSNSGAQAYNLPGNYKDFKSVTVWCRAFGVKFTYANLE